MLSVPAFHPAQLLALLPVATALLLWRLLKAQARMSWLGGVYYSLGGVGISIACLVLEHYLWKVTGLSLEAKGEDLLTSLAAMLFFAAPLEEGSKVLLLWPAYKRGRLRHPADGVLRAVIVATGFAMVESAVFAQRPFDGLLVFRIMLGQFAQVFFAGLWGYVLASHGKVHWLRFAWGIATLFHGLFDHIVFWRGAGTLAAVVPGLIAMLGVTWLGFHRMHHQSAFSLGPTGFVVEGPSLQALTRALKQREQPLMLHWIVMGAFVTLGVVLAFFAAAVYVGHQLGIDFAAANESDMRSNGPLVLLGGAMMAAFPFAGYLIARASGARSVLEPAMGAALAIAAVVALMSMAAPLAVVFALAVAPVAFGLACIGAWFGLTK